MSLEAYKVCERSDKRGVNLISDALPFGRLCYGESNAVSNAVDYAKFPGRSHRAVIRIYDEAGNVIETREHGRSPGSGCLHEKVAGTMFSNGSGGQL
jgi:hypothetical protein